MANLITIGSFVFPTPSSYTANTATIVDSARNVNGYVIGTVIREDVAKISMKWNYLTTEEWSSILQQFDSKYGGNFYRAVTFFNQTSNSVETRNMYVSDRNAESFLLYNADNAPSANLIGLPSAYLNPSLSLIEV